MASNFKQMEELQIHGFDLHSLNPHYDEHDITQFFQRFAKTFYNSNLDGYKIIEQYQYNVFSRSKRLMLLAKRLAELENGLE